MSIQELYDELRANNAVGRTRNDLLANLYKTPHREYKDDMPHFQTLQPNTIHQADLVFLPHDHGYKYLLVCIDTFDRKFDAIPLKEKYSDVVMRAFKVIYEEHKILKFPTCMQFDSGSEFKGDVKDYFHSHKVDVRYALTARHRQQGLIERLNQTIGTLLMKRMTAEELLTHKPATKWVSDVPELIRVLNEHRPQQPKEMDEKKSDIKHKIPDKIEEPIFTKESHNIIPIGTKVRATLDYPIDVGTGKRVHGVFRSGDIRWNPKEREVEEVILRPNLPPMYLLDGTQDARRHTDQIARTFQQLQIIQPNEKKPNPKYIRKETKKEKAEAEEEPVSKYPSRERKQTDRFAPS